MNKIGTMMKYTESMASNFIPVERMKRRSSGSTGSMFLPVPRIKISEINYQNKMSMKKQLAKNNKNGNNK